MSELTSFELEGSLNGQREVLTLILTHLLRNPDEAFTKALEERLAPSNQQEDPGAVPQAAFAVEAARAREIKRMVDDAKARVRSGE
ncbi:hypothetical protein [Tianweitania sp.]|uniref:hypothetical protein n=1 Tax=Tianweitania sp. TaxID=2021634 RepID=UPI0028A1EC17|nr:hypothetical protein [Tianweitania sp.]